MKVTMIAFYLLLAGMLIGIVFYVYSKSIRRPRTISLDNDTSSVGMTAGPVNQTRAAGLIPKIIPVNLRTGKEDEKESD
jgi:hypothetical protein